MHENEIAKIIVDKCFKIHNRLGPGLLESVYEKILLYELKKSNLKCKSQVEIPVIYELIASWKACEAINNGNIGRREVNKTVIKVWIILILRKDR